MDITRPPCPGCRACRTVRARSRVRRAEVAFSATVISLFAVAIAALAWVSA